MDSHAARSLGAGAVVSAASSVSETVLVGLVSDADRALVPFVLFAVLPEVVLMLEVFDAGRVERV